MLKCCRFGGVAVVKRAYQAKGEGASEKCHIVTVLIDRLGRVVCTLQSLEFNR